MNTLSFVENDIRYTVEVTGYSEAEPQTHDYPGCNEEIEYDILSILPASSDYPSFFIGDVVAGEVELEELVLAAYHKDLFDDECDRGDMLHNERNEH